MKTLPRLALWAAVLSIVALCAWGASGLTHHAIMALDKWGDAGAKLSATLDAVNAPCKGYHGSVTCGPIAQLSQTEKNIGILAAQSALQVKQSSTLVNAAATSITGVADQAKITLAAASGTAQEATTALGTMNQTIAQAQPLLGASTTLLTRTDLSLNDPTTGTLPRFNALFPKFSLLADNADGVVGHVNGIAEDAQKVADKETADFLKPVPWWKRPIQRFGEFWDITAAVARHLP